MELFRRQAHVTATVFVVALSLASSVEATQRAVIVGIDKYAPVKDAPDEPSANRVDGPSSSTAGRSGWYDLDGAVNDARAMKDVLALHGFKPDNVALLLDEDATRDAILAAIQKYLVEASQKDDIAFFFYAGHGSQVENSTEVDRLDETLVPADSNLGAWDIRDKELRRLFGDILDRGAHLTAVIDACHSGGIARGFQPGKVRALARDKRDIALFAGTENPDTRPPPGERGALVLSGAQSHQFAMEGRDTDGTSHGAFTLSLLRALRTAPPSEPARGLLLRSKGFMRAEGRTQEPSADALPARMQQPFFGRASSVPPGPLTAPVLSVQSEGRVEVGAGVALRIGPGSMLVQRGEKPVQVRIEKNEGLSRSLGLIVRGDPADLTTGSLLELDRWVPPAGAQLRVWIPPTMGQSKLDTSASEWGELVAAKDLVWVKDPTNDPGDLHVLAWNGTIWTLRAPDGVESALGAQVDANALRARLARTGDSLPRLFVLVPPTPELVAKLRFVSEENSAIEQTADAQSAHYLLAGRAAPTIEYAFLLPEATRAVPTDSALPTRTKWLQRENAAQLDGLARRLARLRAWLALESPLGGGTGFPYRLALKSATRLVADPDSVVRDGEQFELVLRAPEEPRGAQRQKHYVYVFVLDSAGTRFLLFPGPQQGVGENYLPGEVSKGWPEEIPLGVQIRVSPPFGRDTYFVLVTREPLADPGVLQEEGVVRGGLGGSPLGNLVRSINATRGAQVETPVTWSVDRLPLRAEPALQ